MNRLEHIYKRTIYTIQELIDRWRYRTGSVQDFKDKLLNSVADPNQLVGRERPLWVKLYLESRGWRNFQSAAVVGNLMQESFSSLRTDIYGDSGTAYGIAQWRHDRLEKLKEFAEQRRLPLDDLRLQAEYVDWELRNTEKSVGDQLAKTTTIEEALRVAIAYERPRGYTKQEPEKGDGWQARTNNAKSLMT